ncbi:transporter substrate-binding domain-containing protein [Roseibium salinum]|uniref:Transporter substrate-binding domain-containing protein n=1 Tax=Roseibium salinum TaxID=1604349 RepID=A0ABT3QXJ4_9HYPH|nr:transporter substrate-binding domain-containing protein [Roseibium sp. DSM 29163]MCX2721630.1 transporter substrate-binding domain-containing protein [Roseibium sp. DSM 29163]
MSLSTAVMACRAALVAGAASLLAGCADYPRDPEDTTEKARSGTARVGITENPPWTIIRDKPCGLEPALVTAFAKTLGSEVRWESGSESVLLERLENFELDIVIAGLTSKTPWKNRIGTTTPYLTADTDGNGKTEEHIMAVPPGENGWLIRLDRFLHANQRRALVLFSDSARADDPSAACPDSPGSDAGGLDP